MNGTYGNWQQRRDTMPLSRTGSAKSTLSTLQRRATRYQQYIIGASVFIIITSVIIIFTAIILLKFYFLGVLYFWSIYFYITPVFMITLGVYNFIAAGYGAGVANIEHRGLLAVFAVLLSIAFVGQLASIFIAIEVRTTLVLASYSSVDVQKVLQDYNIDPGVTSDWDRMQKELRCCGGLGTTVGHNDYRNVPIGSLNFSVPDSCCMQPEVSCGFGMFKRPPDQIRNTIWTTGCLEAMRYRMDEDVVPMMAIYAGVGVLIAITELIAIVLTCAYIAQINRRRQREEMMWNAIRGDNQMDHELAARTLSTPLTNEHETMC